MEVEEEEEEGGSNRQSGTSVLRKEPFFSRGCGENGIGVENPSSPSRRREEEKESGDLDLPVVRSDGSEGSGSSNEFEHRSMHLNSSFAVYVNRNEEEKRCVPFDVENGGGSYSPAPAAVSIPMLLKTLFFVLVWYALSTCLTIYNKTLLGDKLGKFPAPLLMNTVHFTMQAVLSKVILRFQIRRSENCVKMAWKYYFLRVVPTALATALDINLSNASLVFITVTFATMCKSASPIFLLLFAFAFRLERPSIRLFGIIFVISIGVFLTVEKETQFELWGFVFVMLAAVMSGFRWSMTQILLQHILFGLEYDSFLFALHLFSLLDVKKEAYGLKNPISLMSYVTPVMAVTTLILSLVMEPWTELYKNAYFDSKWHIIRTCLVLLIGGTVAFFMVLTEYILVSTTSAVTVTIAGVVKEAVTILVAVFYFHDQFTLLKGVGLVVIFVGVSLFNLYKYQKLLKGELSNTEETNSVPNGAAKYVILDEMDIEDDER